MKEYYIQQQFFCERIPSIESVFLQVYKCHTLYFSFYTLPEYIHYFIFGRFILLVMLHIGNICIHKYINPICNK